MTKNYLQLQSYNAFVLFLAMGAFAALFAVNSYNLFHQAMQNFRFLREFGSLALTEASFQQQAEIIFYGYLSLAFYVGFNACESELVHRWRGWKAEK
jgi:hypothetical protein